MIEPVEFEEFPKIPRLSREIIITEKIDGTNGQIFIYEGNEGMLVGAGSRSRWLVPGKQDNFGFAAWVEKNREELILKLGPGRHYGEWWGGKIQRGYGLIEKRFSLFNTSRWIESEVLPCHVVPVLYRGPFHTEDIEHLLVRLKDHGSVASPGYMKPEGIVIFHTQGNLMFKKTIEGDEVSKGELHNSEQPRSDSKRNDGDEAEAQPIKL